MDGGHGLTKTFVLIMGMYVCEIVTVKHCLQILSLKNINENIKSRLTCEITNLAMQGVSLNTIVVSA